MTPGRADRASRAAGPAKTGGRKADILASLPRNAWLRIDLERLVENLALLRATLPPGVRLEPVVKADAYGHGAVPVAHVLAAAGADGFCVATFDEALELRKSGLRSPILVLYPTPPGLVVQAARLGVAVVAGDAELLSRALDAVARARADGTLGRRSARFHLEVETGLGRAGFHPDDAPAAAAAIEATPGARLSGLWSHLAAPDDERLAWTQMSRFGDAARLIDDSAVRLPPRHLMASGGLLAASAPSFDSVRIGLALYGLVPDGLRIDDRRLSVAQGLRPVLSLHARPIRVAELPAGTGISYGPSFITTRPSRIATLPLGYADGYSRAFSNRAEALVRGQRVRVVGTVAMDAVMVDVTDVAGPPVGVDDEFVLVGEQGAQRIGIGDLARLRTTISWEVVTSMSRRLPRVYHAAAGAVGIRTLTEERGEWRASSSGTGTSATSRSTRS
ncbi:MAG: alanine racemase [Candidatus Limnocylindrales bacterium]